MNHSRAIPNARDEKRVRIFVVGSVLVLIAIVAGWLLSTGVSLARVMLATLATLPLWIPLHRVIRGERRTYAWMTLCVIPYFVLAITEAVANPAAQPWAGMCLAVAFASFVGSIGYLRVTRSSG